MAAPVVREDDAPPDRVVRRVRDWVAGFAPERRPGPCVIPGTIGRWLDGGRSLV